jgi:6-phosphogluconolactonase
MKAHAILTLFVAAAACGIAAADDGTGPPQAVFTQTNAADGNEVLVFRRNSRGEVDLSASVDTGGLGTGAGLGSQEALALTRDGRHLYVVNAGSDTISVFAVRRHGLALIQQVASGGDQPISLTVKDDLLYVLNAGAGNNISGFRVGADGRLRALLGSSRPLSGPAVEPAQVLFNNTGDVLVVTEKMTNRIDLYAVDDGLAEGPFVNDSSGATPFGFAFDRRDRLVVSEAFADTPGASAVSSYDLDAADEPLEVISASVRAGQTAACWVAITQNGRYAFVTNTGSGTVTTFVISRNGELSPLTPDGVNANTGAGSMPQDAALSRNSKLLFVLAPGTGTLQSFAVLPNGALRHVDTAQGIPASAQGLAAQ